MTLNEVRSRYLSFFSKRGHTVIPSSSLIPENDPTTLFTGSGMQPLVPYLLGKNHPAGARLVDSQKCFRSMDIEEVGDNRHTTFFEMLGNWSLGDYFKEEQLPWFFEFLTDPKEGVDLDPNRLYITVFAGEEKFKLPRDTQSAALWRGLFDKKRIQAAEAVIGSEENGYIRGIKPGERIFYYDAKKNWWSRAGTPEHMPEGEPGGPDSEVFYEFTHISHDKAYGEHCHPNCDCGRFLEIGNSVFMQYLKKGQSFELLPKQNVDFGGGLERIAMVSEGNNDIFSTNHKELLRQLEQYSKKTYGKNQNDTRAMRIVADHIKASVFLIADGAMPGNVERGYIVRRLLRRAVRYADLLGIPPGTLEKFTQGVVEEYHAAYTALRERERIIEDTIAKEEERFRETLTKGIREFEKFIEEKGSISGEAAFTLFTTYGFPLELTKELADERGVSVAEKEFNEHMRHHRELSRAGSEQKFRGGLADTAEKTVRLHTAHHLLLRALQIVLGPEVKQRGSNITQERLRIDFSYGAKMTKEQIAEVEKIVNEKIEEDLPVIRTEMSREEAEKLGAEHEFGQKYPERVSVYSVGPKGATSEDPKFNGRYSIEFCGGPHVSHTSELAEGGRHFKIQKEEAVSAGIRRIKAVLA
ncbi:MAG: alanine--tRNA ligase [Patescibacteria group bacterium]|nr:alanine--tRNA ligase [Patescibacteria group bacterium]